jgi:hypothetical protein
MNHWLDCSCRIYVTATIISDPALGWNRGRKYLYINNNMRCIYDTVLFFLITKNILHSYVRFQVLTVAIMMFRIVFWDVLPCKIIVDRRFSIHHQGSGSTHLWNVGRQLFYTAVHPRRQFWTSFFTAVFRTSLCFMLLHQPFNLKPMTEKS